MIFSASTIEKSKKAKALFYQSNYGALQYINLNMI